MINFFRKTPATESEGDKPSDQGDSRKVHLRELVGGERVLQLWENLKADREREAKMGGVAFNSVSFNSKLSSFLYHAMEALAGGQPPKVPVVEPDLPSWMKGRVKNGSDDHRRRMLFSRGWTEEQIESIDPEFFQPAILGNWSPQKVVEHAATVQAERKKRQAEQEWKRRNTPQFR